MSIYIPGMELPPNVEGCEIIIRIQPDGTVLNAEKIHLGMKAIEVPEHGRLGDLDAFFDEILGAYGIDADEGDANRMMNFVCSAPTIIPADGTKEAADG